MRDLEYGIVAKDRSGPGFDSAEARARRFNGVLDETNNAYMLAGTAAKAFVGAFALSTVADFGRIVKGVLADAGDLADLSDKVGISTEDIQRLQYGFKLVGIEAGEVDGLLTQWTKRIGEAYTGGGKLADILKANGVSLTDGTGHLRSSVDLMRDYAELVSRAGSDQERMMLALAGFGKSGDNIVLAFRDGAKGLDDLMDKINDAGGALEDQMVRKGADIDDEFEQMWQTFETGAKRAILNSAGALDNFITTLRNNSAHMMMFQTNPEVMSPTQLGEWFGKRATDPATLGKSDRVPATLDERFNGMFEPVDQNSDLERMLRDRFAPKTIIPNDVPARKASTAAATEQQSAYEKVIEKLTQERDMIGLSATEQAIMNELRRAGVTATSAEGQAITALVADMERQKAAQKALTEQTEFLKSTTANFFTTFRHGMEDGEGLLASFENAFSGVVDSIATKIEDRLAGQLVDALMGPASGGGGFGLLNSLFGSTSAFVPNTTLGGFLGGTSLPPAPSGNLLPAPAARGGAPNVKIINNAGVDVRAGSERDEGGQESLLVTVDKMQAANNARPGSKASRSMKTRFGIRDRLTKR